MSAREFNQDVSAAKRAAEEGPVLITERGEPAFVLLSIDEYRRLGETGADLVDRLSMPEDADVDFEPVQLHPKVPDLWATCSTRMF
ncbi:type II toxin-antitoxin system prevent-host-death family antitoxin [Prauserella aidingensis]|uniref:type II toxin-antitoxin system prevent-host-death family antitoxin n=1 Tax=Prauserella aidingensis TaxID=387890 RepID=UPI0020A2E92B|nr:type II toxin-antitoxin system prevent-host-death family antitoxin [Prauserella aidingensis]